MAGMAYSAGSGVVDDQRDCLDGDAARVEAERVLVGDADARYHVVERHQASLPRTAGASFREEAVQDYEAEDRKSVV